MTRINCIPVKELADKHLLAEYRELPRISGLIWKWFNKTHAIVCGVEMWVCPVIPPKYVLGTGHVTFFYNKGEYLRRRFEDEIVPEMKARGFNPIFSLYRMHPEGYNKNWIPSESDMLINRQRIADRLANKKAE